MPTLDPIALWDVPHVAASVVRASETVESHGDLDRVFKLASLTKLFTAYATLLAIEEGVIGLDSPAGQPGSTVRHLLAHTGGYGFDSDSHLLVTPGKRRIYSNRGIEILAETVQTAVGMPFATYIHEGVLGPLAMTHSAFVGSAAFGMSSSVTDLTRFVQELMSPQLLAAETVAEAFRVHFPGIDGVLPGWGTQRPLDWGLGFEVRSTKHPHWAGSLTSPETVGHFGGAGTFLWFDPLRSLSLICLTDRRFGNWAVPIWPALSDAVVTDYG